uniref:Uncharacterized protein n=1 Tax=Meloidogyne enterolobii TaxID=390850 RepID=A0A6V7XZF2_MELEN|nr:unnamed protein product [Meloidogyne enterolobii]
MDLYFFHHNDYERLYNCSIYNIDQIPLEKRQHKILGIFVISLSTIYEILYIPCMFSIWKRMANSHCYKIMFAIGVIDMATILAAGFLTGYLGYFGYVFCSSPKFIYFVGAYAACKKLLLWLGIPILYGLSIITWSKPVIFTGIYFSWFLNPHIGYIDDVNQEYENTLNAFHNSLIIFFLLITYLTFFIIFVIKSKHGEFESSQQSYSEIMVLYNGNNGHLQTRHLHTRYMQTTFDTRLTDRLLQTDTDINL